MSSRKRKRDTSQSSDSSGSDDSTNSDGLSDSESLPSPSKILQPRRERKESVKLEVAAMLQQESELLIASPSGSSHHRAKKRSKLESALDNEEVLNGYRQGNGQEKDHLGSKVLHPFNVCDGSNTL
jgi:hypothetical protein